MTFIFFKSVKLHLSLFTQVTQEDFTKQQDKILTKRDFIIKRVEKVRNQYIAINNKKSEKNNKTNITITQDEIENDFTKIINEINQQDDDNIDELYMNLFEVNDELQHHNTTKVTKIFYKIANFLLKKKIKLPFLLPLFASDSFKMTAMLHFAIQYDYLQRNTSDPEKKKDFQKKYKNIADILFSHVSKRDNIDFSISKQYPALEKFIVKYKIPKIKKKNLFLFWEIKEKIPTIQHMNNQPLLHLFFCNLVKLNDWLPRKIQIHTIMKEIYKKYQLSPSGQFNNLLSILEEKYQSKKHDKKYNSKHIIESLEDIYNNSYEQLQTDIHDRNIEQYKKYHKNSFHMFPINYEKFLNKYLFRAAVALEFIDIEKNLDRNQFDENSLCKDQYYMLATVCGDNIEYIDNDVPSELICFADFDDLSKKHHQNSAIYSYLVQDGMLSTMSPDDHNRYFDHLKTKYHAYKNRIDEFVKSEEFKMSLNFFAKFFSTSESVMLSKFFTHFNQDDNENNSNNQQEDNYKNYRYVLTQYQKCSIVPIDLIKSPEQKEQYLKMQILFYTINCSNNTNAVRAKFDCDSGEHNIKQTLSMATSSDQISAFNMKTSVNTINSILYESKKTLRESVFKSKNDTDATFKILSMKDKKFQHEQYGYNMADLSDMEILCNNKDILKIFFENIEDKEKRKHLNRNIDELKSSKEFLPHAEIIINGIIDHVLDNEYEGSIVLKKVINLTSLFDVIKANNPIIISLMSRQKDYTSTYFKTILERVDKTYFIDDFRHWSHDSLDSLWCHMFIYQYLINLLININNSHSMCSESLGQLDLVIDTHSDRLEDFVPSNVPKEHKPLPNEDIDYFFISKEQCNYYRKRLAISLKLFKSKVEEYNNMDVEIGAHIYNQNFEKTVENNPKYDEFLKQLLIELNQNLSFVEQYVFTDKTNRNLQEIIDSKIQDKQHIELYINNIISKTMAVRPEDIIMEDDEQKQLLNYKGSLIKFFFVMRGNLPQVNINNSKLLDKIAYLNFLFGTLTNCNNDYSQSKYIIGKPSDYQNKYTSLIGKFFSVKKLITSGCYLLGAYGASLVVKMFSAKLNDYSAKIDNILQLEQKKDQNKNIQNSANRTNVPFDPFSAVPVKIKHENK